MSQCPCRGLEGEDLLICLAPPRGEWEVHIDLPGGGLGVVNSEGIFLRVVRYGEALPFMETIDRRVNLETLLRRAKIDYTSLLCMALEGLREAARNGSIKALKRVEECKEVIEKIWEECPS